MPTKAQSPKKNKKLSSAQLTQKNVHKQSKTSGAKQATEETPKNCYVKYKKFAQSAKKVNIRYHPEAKCKREYVKLLFECLLPANFKCIWHKQKIC